jgi:SAM-dependent methyltransferase
MDREFTGERFIPGQGGAEIAYEHMHRYLFARRFAPSGRVLDVASGEGYGAALLAAAGRLVCGLELDAGSVAAARARYGSRGVEFLRGDAAGLPLATGSIRLAVAFEVLEHVAVENQERLVAELARVSARDGIVLISTPDRKAYSEARRYSNPFHTRELDRREFHALLAAHFGFVRLYRQQVRAGSVILADDASPGAGSEVLSDPAPEGRAAPSSELYFIAAAAHTPVLDALPSASSYVDRTDFLIEMLHSDVERLGAWGKSLEQAVAERDAQLRTTMEDGAREIDSRDATIRGLQDKVADEVRWRGMLQGEVTRVTKEFEDRSRWALDLEQQVGDRDRKLGNAMQDLDQTIRDLRRLEGRFEQVRRSLAYRILRRLRLIPE